jgi:hypothetical protein
MAKRGGHGTNYYGKPLTMAKHLKVPTKIMEDFQDAYLPAFGLSKWHAWVAQQLQLDQRITTLLGSNSLFSLAALTTTRLSERQLPSNRNLLLATYSIWACIILGKLATRAASVSWPSCMTQF